MLVFRYDKSFDGLLSALFDAYSMRAFPEALIGPGNPNRFLRSASTTLRPTRRMPAVCGGDWNGG